MQIGAEERAMQLWGEERAMQEEREILVKVPPWGAVVPLYGD